jgi:predicted transcriptional regulator of viral defense system
MPPTTKQHIGDYVNDLQSHGLYTFTTKELAKVYGGSDIAIRSAIRRLCHKNRLSRPTHGFQIIVPTEYMNEGAPPANWFIDDLMKHVHRPYYVGLLSAASLHGASHQQPQEFQVVTNKSMRPMHIGRNNIVFYKNSNIQTVLTEQHKTPTGFITVSTLEATMLDVVRAMDYSGGLDTTATILSELSSNASSAKLAIAAEHAMQTTLQRLGFLLEELNQNKLANALNPIIARRRKNPTLLRPSSAPESNTRNNQNNKLSSSSTISNRWNIIPNETFELEA